MVEDQRSVAAGRGDIVEGWVGGWVAFAAIIMMIAGGLHVTFGLVAVLDDHWPAWTQRSHALLSVSAWGWVQIAIGIAVTAAGVGVVLGRPVARAIGVLFAGLSLLDGFFVIPLYQWWALVIIGLDVLVIWALTVHWHDTTMGPRPQGV
jgi:hypothetical protein